MKVKIIRNFIISAVFFAMFLTLTVLVTTVDVQPIGPKNTEIGLSTMNAFFRDRLGASDIWYSITTWMGNIALLVVGCFGLLGLVQLIKRKSFFKVDFQILLLGAFYIIVGLVYVIFEFMVINYRPILMDGALEASYPSSHTVLGASVMLAAIVFFHTTVPQKKKLLIPIDIFCILFTVVMETGRLLSGIHWFSDIIAGLLISFALVALYRALILLIPILIEKHNKKSIEKK